MVVIRILGSKFHSIFVTNAWAAVLLLGCVGAVFGQTSTGTLTGTITDPQGAAMADASVVLHNVDTGVDQRPVTTNDSGIYTVAALPPGTYDVTVNHTGFTTVQQKGIRVQVGQTVRIDIQMPVAGQQSLVTVTAETPLLETEKTEQSQNVTENLVSNLPISSRRWEQFVLLTPGVTTDGPSGALSFHGVSSLYNNNSVDGANNNNAFNGTARGGTNDGYVYSADSIREFQVASSNFGAELGQSAGGSVNAVTKSGTSQFHGDLFYNGRAPNFNALDPVTKNQAAANGVTPTKPVHQQHQWGGSLGGPIIKDKLFFFVTDDGYRKINPLAISTVQTNPPIGSLACPTAITAAQCATAKNFVLTNLVGQFPQSIRQDIELVKLDYQFNQAHHFNVVANIRDWKQPTTGSLAPSGQSNFIQDRFVIANWTMLIGSNKVNELRYQWGRDNTFAQSPGTLPGVVLTNIASYFQTASISGYTNEVRNQVSDNFAFSKGTHAFKTGVDINFIHDVRRSGTPMPGRYTYSSAVGAIAGCPSSGTGLIFCDWLVDVFGATVPGDTAAKGKHWTQFSQLKDARCPTNAVGSCAGTDDEDFSDYGFYFQDAWKARSNLTFNLGLRYDIQFALTPMVPNTLTPLLAKYTSTLNNDYKGGIQPRLGVAWNFAKNSVVRAGFGIFYAKTVVATYSHVHRSTGLREATFTCDRLASDAICGPLTFPNVLFLQQVVAPAPVFAGALTPIALDPATGAAGALLPGGGLDPNDVRPRVYEGEVAFERQLSGNINFSASYVFSRGVHLPGHWDVNLAAPTVTKTYDVVTSPTNGATSLVSPVPFFTTRVDPTVGPMLVEFSQVNSRYSGMVLTGRKPMSHGVELLVNYTLSKATDGGSPYNTLGTSGTFLEGQQILNPYDRTIAQGPSGTDTRHRFTTSAVWAPNFDKLVSGRVAKTLLGGWGLATTVTASSGTRYSALVSSTAIQCSKTIIAPVTTCAGAGGVSGLDGGMTAAMLMNTSVPAAGPVYFLPRAGFRLPHYTNLDLRLTKQFNIRERFNFELRGEAFNLFNNTIIQAVDANAYTYGNPTASGSGAITCPSTGANAHLNTCMVPLATFQKPTTTSSNLLGARQLQAGIRFSF